MSKKTVITLILMFIIGFLACLAIMPTEAPNNEREVPQDGQTAEKAVDIGQNPVEASFEELLDAIEWVESGGDANAVGDGGNAIGSFQIWKIYVDDVNRIFKLYIRPMYRKDTFSYEDRWNRDKSREMAFYYMKYYRNIVFAGRDNEMGIELEMCARIHNAGPDGWRNDPHWFVRNRGYTLEQAKKKIRNAKSYWEKAKKAIERK